MRMNLSVITDLVRQEFVGEELEDVEPEEEPDDDAPVPTLSLTSIPIMRKNKRKDPNICQTIMNNNINR